MPVRDRLHISCFVVVLAAAALASACDDELSVLPGGIEGRACDPDTGLGLPGAVIEARGPTNKKAAADAEGRFVFSGLTPGAYDVVALLEGGAEHRVGDPQLVVKSDTVATADDTACSGDPGEGGRGNLDGQVCDRHTGGFISDAEVVVLLANGQQITGRTDGSGNFAIADVPEGSHVVTIRAAGFQRSFPITIVPGQTFTIDIADNCQPPSSTSGAIAGEFCDPTTDGALAGAAVLVHRTEPPSSPDEDVRELTDTDGRFFVAGLVPGSYRVSVTKEGVSPVTAVVDVSSGETATVAGPDECASRTPVGRIEGQICD
jgi:hypothetical protein